MKRFTTALVCLGVTFGLLAAVELGLRVLHIIPKDIPYPVYFTDLIGDYQPHLDIIDQTPKLYPYPFKTNSQGLRSLREISWKKQDGVVRILCLGDSYTMGWGVKDDETISEQLYQILRKRHPGIRFEVINAGLLFSNALDHIDYFRQKGRQLQPDIVIEQYCYNDVDTDMLRKAVGRKVQRLERQHGLGFMDMVFQTAIGKLALRTKAALLTRGAPQNALASGYSEVSNDPTDDLAALLIAPTPETISHLLRYAVLRPPTDPTLKKIWGNYLAGVDILRDEVARSGARMLFLAIPNLYQVGEFKDGHSSVFYPYAKACGLNYIDINRRFRAYPGKSYQDLFLPADGHTSPLGNRLIAEEIANRLDFTQYPPEVTVLPNPRDMSYAQPVRVALSPTPGGDKLTTLSDGAPLVRSIKVTSEGMVCGNDLFYHCKDERGVMTIEFTFSRPVAHCDIQFFMRLFNDAKKANSLTLSHSFDGRDFSPIYAFPNDGSEVWDSMENGKVFEIVFPRDRADRMILRIEFTHDAGLAFDKPGGGDNQRRIQANIYPARP